MRNRKSESGLSLAELLVAATILIVGFSATYRLMADSRKRLKAEHGTGHHVHFEAFSSSRLRLYFSKLMQWTTHLGGESDDKSDERKKAFKEYCKFTSNFAYATAPLKWETFSPEDREMLRLKEDKDGNLKVVKRSDKSVVFEETENGDPQFVRYSATAEDNFIVVDEDGIELLETSKKFRKWLKQADSDDFDQKLKKFYLNKVLIPEQTLAADMRLSLSTLNWPKVNNWRQTGLLDKYDFNEFLWGAMVPFASDTSGEPDSLSSVNPNLKNYCSLAKIKPTTGIGVEMCKWVNWCTGADRTKNPLNDDFPILAFKSGTKAVPELYGVHSFHMCFAFVGNLFSRTGDFYAGSGAAGVGAENPATLGFTVATATLTDSRSGDPVVCNNAIYNMYRSFRIQLTNYTVYNADKEFNTNRQSFNKTVKEFTAEKLGVDRPNCRNKLSRNRISRINDDLDVADLPICIADPLFHYVCSGDGECGDPK